MTKHNLSKRKSIRLKNYNYSSSGHYYVTICTQERKCLFGKIINNKMVLNNVGKMINKLWLKIPERFTNVMLDEFIIMPNHLHGIVVIGNKINEQQSVGAGFMPAHNAGFMPARSNNRATTRVAPTLGDIIGAFKSLTTHEYINGVNNNNWPPFNKRLWQRNYYENIIRNENDLNKIREYIKTNPEIWHRDRNNPGN